MDERTCCGGSSRLGSLQRRRSDVRCQKRRHRKGPSKKRLGDHGVRKREPRSSAGHRMYSTEFQLRDSANLIISASADSYLLLVLTYCRIRRPLHRYHYWFPLRKCLTLQTACFSPFTTVIVQVITSICTSTLVCLSS
jgi:hypothetical protein